MSGRGKRPSKPLLLGLALGLGLVSARSLWAAGCDERQTSTVLLRLVDRYGQGGPEDRAVVELARWPSPCIRQAALALVAQDAEPCRLAGDRDRSPHCLRRARMALLLTEVAAVTRFAQTAPAMRESPHVSLAWECLRPLRSQPGRKDFVADWLSVASRVSLAMGRIGESLEYVQLGLTHARERIQVNLAAALVYEALPRLQASMPVDIPRHSFVRVRYRGISAIQTMGRAEEALRRALAKADDKAEVHLRLGHVLQKRKELTEARQHLQRVLTLNPSPRERSLALLFLGQIEDGAGAFELAAEHYRHAVRASPESQTAYLALSELLDRQGDSGRAREVAQAAVEYGRAETSDWVLYGFGDMEETLAELRRLLAQVTP